MGATVIHTYADADRWEARQMSAQVAIEAIYNDLDAYSPGVIRLALIEAGEADIVDLMVYGKVMDYYLALGGAGE